MLGRLSISEVDAVNMETIELYNAAVEDGDEKLQQRYVRTGRRLLAAYGHELQELAEQEDIQREIAKIALTFAKAA